MSGEQVQCRLEWRYLVSPRLLARFLASSPAGWRRHYPRRRVLSIYYDTPRLDDYHLAVAGVVPRRKLRLRRYPNDHGSGWLLECKRRTGAELHKITLPLQPGIDPAGLPPPVRAGLAGRRLGLATRFWRSYWIHRHGPVRLTVDEHLQAGRAGLWLPLGPGNSVLVELKFAPELEALARRLAAPLGRARSGGKYKAAVERFGGRFLPWQPVAPTELTVPGTLAG